LIILKLNRLKNQKIEGELISISILKGLMFLGFKVIKYERGRRKEEYGCPCVTTLHKLHLQRKKNDGNQH